MIQSPHQNFQITHIFHFTSDVTSVILVLHKGVLLRLIGALVTLVASYLRRPQTSIQAPEVATKIHTSEYVAAAASSGAEKLS